MTRTVSSSSRVDTPGVVRQDEVPAIETVFAAVHHHVARLGRIVLRPSRQEVADAAAVDAGDRFLWLHAGTFRLVRVVGGAARGRRLQAPLGSATRPTSDRVREAIFSMLESMAAVSGATVVDLFAGSGALGIEALSRGAAAATFVERDPATARLIRSNLSSLGDDFVGRSSVVVSDAVAFASGMSGCDVLFADPPYAFSAWGDLLAHLGDSAALVVAETGGPWEPVSGWRTVKEKTYGGTVVTVVRHPGPGEI